MPGRLSGSLWLAGRFAAAIGLYACIAAALLNGLTCQICSPFLVHPCYCSARPYSTIAMLPATCLLRLPLQPRSAPRRASPAALADGICGYRATRGNYCMAQSLLSGLYQAAAFFGCAALAGASQAIVGSGRHGASAGVTIALAAASLLLGLLLIVAERWIAALANRQLNAQLEQAPALALARMLRVSIAACLFVAATIFAQLDGVLG